MIVNYTYNPEKTERLKFHFKSLSASLLVLGCFYLATAELLENNKHCFINSKIYDSANLTLR